MRLIDADALAMKLRYMGYMDENEEIQEVIDRFAEECDDDSISRQAAIYAMLQLQDEDIEAYGCRIPEGFDGNRAVEELKALPSAEPERKTGKWIPWKAYYDKDHKSWTDELKCSECGYQWGDEEYNFCPNCGSYNGGGDAE